MKKIAIRNPNVERVFAAYPQPVRTKLMALRGLILDVAAKTAVVGELEETLKWGQPSYLTTETRSGSMIRIDQIKSKPGQYAMFFHCQTTLVDRFKEMYRDTFIYGGNRCLIFDAATPPPEAALRHCIAMALTYQFDKKRPVS